MDSRAKQVFAIAFIALITTSLVIAFVFHDTVLALSFGLLSGYTFGAYTVYKRLFPYEFLKSAVALFFGGTGPGVAIKARHTIFRSFNPQSDIVMIGDGITEDATWNEMFPEHRIANRGVGGDMVSDILQRMDTIVSVLPKKAFLMAGIVDFMRGHSAEHVLPQMKKIVHDLLDHKIAVYLQSTLECSKSCSPAALIEVRKLNRLLEEYAKTKGIIYIDINDGLTSQDDGLLEQYTDAGIHLLGPGYVIWMEKIRPYL